MRFRRFGDLAANFALQAREHKPLQGIAAQARKNSTCGCSAGANKLSVSCHIACIIGFNFHAQHFRAFAAVDGQHTMGRNFAEQFLELEIIAEFFSLLLGDLGFRVTN